MLLYVYKNYLCKLELVEVSNELIIYFGILGIFSSICTVSVVIDKKQIFSKLNERSVVIK